MNTTTTITINTASSTMRCVSRARSSTAYQGDPDFSGGAGAGVGSSMPPVGGWSNVGVLIGEPFSRVPG